MKIIPESDAAVDLNPMLDVIFILLIFFIVVASFQQERVLPIEEPGKAAGDRKSASLILEVDANNQVFHNHHAIAVTALRGYIAQARAENGADLSVLVMAHSAASVQAYADIVDAAQLALVDTVMVKILPL